MNNNEISRYSKRIARMFWDPPPKNDDSSPIWCLGRCYELEEGEHDFRNRRLQAEQSTNGDSNHLRTQISASSNDKDGTESSFVEVASADEEPAMNSQAADDGWPSPFLEDFQSRIWLTYRSNFEPIAKSQDPNASSAISWTVRLRNQLNQEGFTSDTGWGCMIRSGQSILANALSISRLGRDWRRNGFSNGELEVVSLFADDPKAPFSIHKFVEHGASACGKHPGEWFGPSATARCIKALSDAYAQTNLRVYMTGDGSEVYEDCFLRTAKDSDGSFHPTLVLVGIRLGIHRITPVYWEALKASLQMPQSVGIAGGRPAASHYFVGVQGNHFFYLDPHLTRPFLPYHSDLSLYSLGDIDSCHTDRLRRIHIEEMDPSMLIAFLIKNENDWKAWREGVISVQGKAVVSVASEEPTLHGTPRAAAIDEVESFDEDEDSIGGF